MRLEGSGPILQDMRLEIVREGTGDSEAGGGSSRR